MQLGEAIVVEPGSLSLIIFRQCGSAEIPQKGQDTYLGMHSHLPGMDVYA